MTIFLIIVIVYILIVFVLSRLFIPHLGFIKDKLPEKIPTNWEKIISELKNRAQSKNDFLSLAYDYIGRKYFFSGIPFFRRFNLFTRFPSLFYDLDDLYSVSGFMHCPYLNFLMRLFLVKSGFFQEEEIKLKHIFVNFVIHQYLEVKLNDKWVAVDVFEYSNGLKIGQHLKTFSL
jgi:hypothetical protein